jgi:hypothetical protein
VANKIVPADGELKITMKKPTGENAAMVTMPNCATAFCESNADFEVRIESFISLR